MSQSDNVGIVSGADDGFEVIQPTETSAEVTSESRTIRKLCACGCGEEVTGNRALKRGHTMGEGLSASIFSGNDILVLQMAMVSFVGALTVFVEAKTDIPRMEPEESTAIGEPLGRILARHIPKAVLKRMKPGDVADSVAIITIASAYIMRISSMKKENKQVATNGYIDNQTISGLTQYEYRPPEQISIQENDNAN